MKKYIISEGNFDKLLQFFGVKKRPEVIDTLINNDAKLKKLDKEMGDLNRQAADRIRQDDRMRRIFQRAGVDITGGF